MTDIADEMAKWGGGWLDNIKEAVVSGGKWKAIPLGNVGQQMVYRIDWFKEAGYDKFPDTWDELLEAGIKLKAKGRPVRLRVRLRLRRQPRLDVPAALVVRRPRDGQGRQDRHPGLGRDGEVGRFCAKSFFEKTQFQDVLGWTDVNNNRAFLAEQISCTNNATSILQTAQKEFPQLVDVIGHAPNPKGPSGERFSLLNPLELRRLHVLARPGSRQEPRSSS